VRAAVLLLILATALEGQLLLLEDIPSPAVILYSVAFAGFIAWLALCRPVPLEEPSHISLLGWSEWLLVILTLALAAFARFHVLSRIPYGIEGDESKWTSEVVSVMLDGQHVLQSEYHYRTEPVSFYMQAPFHRIFGPGILSARIAVATYSLLATLVFYWLVRETLGPPVALLATALLAICPVDVSASRLAPVEAHVKLWAILPLALLAHGLRVHRAVYSFLAGAALVAGLLTYETVVPMVAVAVLWTPIALAYRRAALREWVMHLTALLTPVLLVAPFVIEYLWGKGYLLGRVPYYNPGHLSWSAAPVSLFVDNLGQVVQNFWSQTTGDFLYNRPGPIINGSLVPLLALGLVLALVHVRRPGYALPLLWFVLVFFPVPIYTGSPFVRVFYPAFPAIWMRWWMEDAAGPAQATLQCERLRPGIVVVEAEDMTIGSGWQVDRGFVPDFRGRGYLADQMTLGSASITVTLPATGTQNLWIRTYYRALDDYPLYLTVDGQTFTHTCATDTPLGSWTWVRMASVNLGAGTHTIRIARPIQDRLPDTYPVWVDTLLLSDDPAFSPAEESEWLPLSAIQMYP